uniref:Gem (nuclear organelle) associated protein 7 n=1 Tax=Dicentrarchus labrax TaxID=13489 RepID=A0A8C4DAJ2_DICLA
MTTPVSVLRLPKGPDPNSRGFDPKSPRFIALCRTSIPTSAGSESDAEQLQEEQHARSVLRETFLRCLLSISNKKVQFRMHEKVKVDATFGASDIDVLNFQVSDLHTPIGVQKEALISTRGSPKPVFQTPESSDTIERIKYQKISCQNDVMLSMRLYVDGLLWRDAERG